MQDYSQPRYCKSSSYLYGKKRTHQKTGKARNIKYVSADYVI